MVTKLANGEKGVSGDKTGVSSNLLVDALDAASRSRVEQNLQFFNFDLGHIVCEAGGQIDHVYFPMGAVISLLTVLENGTAIETANIGREGAYGMFAAMYGGLAFNRSVIQLKGKLARLPIEIMRQEFESNEAIRKLFIGYAETQVSQIQQTAACNAMHSIKKRICRWLLMIQDRSDGKELPYTHEFLSEMLGANRKSVTVAAQELQAAGLIVYNRGKIQVANRGGLKRASCECYQVVRDRADIFYKRPKLDQ